MLIPFCTTALCAALAVNSVAPGLLREMASPPYGLDAVPTAKDKDGKNDVVGAIWKVDARNGAGKTESFRFRAKDGKLYNTTGKLVGAIKPLGQGESMMTWNDPLPIQGQFKINMSKVGRWGGTLKTNEGVEWRCRLECIDR